MHVYFMQKLENRIFKTCLLCIYNINIIFYKYNKNHDPEKSYEILQIPAEREFIQPEKIKKSHFLKWIHISLGFGYFMLYRVCFL